MLTFAVEQWPDIWQEATGLWGKHYDEVGQGRHTGWVLNPALEIFDAIHRMGKMHIVVARCSGLMVGYHASIVEPLKHYKQVLAGISDLYWLAPEHRNGRNAIRLFQKVEASLRDRGVQVLFDATKIDLDRGELFEFLGYKLIEKKYSKCLT